MSKYNQSSINELVEDWESNTLETDGKKRKEIAKHALKWLQNRREPATAEDFKQALYEEYHIDGQSQENWWRTAVRPVLRDYAGPREAHLVEYKHGRHEYRWVGEPDTHLRGHRWVD